jgi:hypothetical protein
MYRKFKPEKLNERDHSEDVGIGGRIILEWILNMLRSCGVNASVSGEEPIAGFCEHGNELSGSG